MGPASRSSFSSGVGCGALGSFFAGVLPAEAPVGFYTNYSQRPIATPSRPKGALTAVPFSLPKKEVIVALGG